MLRTVWSSPSRATAGLDSIAVDELRARKTPSIRAAGCAFGQIGQHYFGMSENCMRILKAKDVKYDLSRLVDLAHAKPVAMTKHGRPMVVAMAAEVSEPLTALEMARSPTGDRKARK